MTTALYVEDNPDNIIIMQKILSTVGYDVLVANDGQTALQLAETYKPDFIIMDLHLSGMNGLEATRKLKSRPHLAHIPVIALTADINSQELFTKAGCDIYLTKPIRRTSLIRTIHQVLGKHYN